MRDYESEIICDLAETYHVYDMRALPPITVATLVFGLRADSRLVMKCQGVKEMNHLLILASINDLLRWFQWAISKDGKHKRNMPKWLVSQLTEADTKKSEENLTFTSGEDFLAYRQKLLEGK